jgi:hypothetical protein
MWAAPLLVCDVLYRSQNRRTGGESDTIGGHIVSRLNRIIAAVFSTYITLKRKTVADRVANILMLYTRACEPGRDDRHAQTHNTPRIAQTDSVIVSDDAMVGDLSR